MFVRVYRKLFMSFWESGITYKYMSCIFAYICIYFRILGNWPHSGFSSNCRKIRNFISPSYIFIVDWSCESQKILKNSYFSANLFKHLALVLLSHCDLCRKRVLFSEAWAIAKSSVTLFDSLFVVVTRISRKKASA